MNKETNMIQALTLTICVVDGNFDIETNSVNNTRQRKIQKKEKQNENEEEGRKKQKQKQQIYIENMMETQGNRQSGK